HVGRHERLRERRSGTDGEGLIGEADLPRPADDQFYRLLRGRAAFAVDGIDDDAGIAPVCGRHADEASFEDPVRLEDHAWRKPGLISYGPPDLRGVAHRILEGRRFQYASASRLTKEKRSNVEGEFEWQRRFDLQ